MYETWTAPQADGATSREMALVIAGKGPLRLLVLPPLFDEANKLRRQLHAVMRRLSTRGIASVLPDLPGCNESTASLAKQTLNSWRAASAAAATHFAASHVLAVRSAANLAPEGLPGWLYAPHSASKLLRSLARAQSLAEGETGKERQPTRIIEAARAQGATIAGWPLGAEMITQLESAKEPAASDLLALVDHDAIGGPPLWLRAEASEDAAQAEALASLIATGMTA